MPCLATAKYRIGDLQKLDRLRTVNQFLFRRNISIRNRIEKIDLVIRKVKKFYALFSAQWHTDNKPNGFEVQDARLGGLIARLSACRKRLSDWADGKGDLPELKEERVYAAPEKNGELDGLLYNCWTATISACPV